MIVYVRKLYKPSLIYKLFGKFKIEEIQGKTIINLPINSKSHKRRVKRITEKLCKYLYKNSIRNVVLEQELFNNEEFKNTLYSNNENILDGSKLAKFLVYKVIQKVFNLKNKKTIFSFKSSNVDSYSYSTFVKATLSDSEETSVYNLLTGKSMNFDSDSQVSIYSNYIIVTKNNTKTYYNTKFAEIYKE